MTNLIKPAIIAIGYNRPNSMKRLLTSIGKSKIETSDVTLIVSIDKSEKTHEIIKIAEDFNWKYGEKIIQTFEERQGLREHILKCGDLSTKYGAVIILEDDIVVSPMFYDYTIKAINNYKNDDRIAGIALYSHKWNGYSNRFFDPIYDGQDTYLAQFSITWGQCWSEYQWNQFKQWYEKNKFNLEYKEYIPANITDWPETSWGKYFVYYMVEMNKYYVMPYISLATNFSEVGQHAKEYDSSHQVPLLLGNKDYKFTLYNEAVKYDIFFENKNLYKYIYNDVNKSEICIDLYGTKKFYSNYRYLLTTKKKPYKILKSYGLQMRPHEMNIISDIQGNDIFLYDLSEKLEKSEINTLKSDKIIKYELRGLTNRRVLFYTLKNIIKNIRIRILNK